MTFALTSQILTGATTTGTGTTVYPQRRQDELGKIQAKIVSGTATVKIQGRAEPGAPWATLLTITEVDMSDNDTVYALIELVPEMRANVINISGATVDVWLTE